VYTDKLCAAFFFDRVDLQNEDTAILYQVIARFQDYFKIAFFCMFADYTRLTVNIEGFLTLNDGDAQTAANVKGIYSGASVQKPVAAL